MSEKNKPKENTYKTYNYLLPLMLTIFQILKYFDAVNILRLLKITKEPIEEYHKRMNHIYIDPPPSLSRQLNEGTSRLPP